MLSVALISIITIYIIIKECNLLGDINDELDTPLPTPKLEEKMVSMQSSVDLEEVAMELGMQESFKADFTAMFKGFVLLVSFLYCISFVLKGDYRANNAQNIHMLLCLALVLFGWRRNEIFCRVPRIFMTKQEIKIDSLMRHPAVKEYNITREEIYPYMNDNRHNVYILQDIIDNRVVK